MSEKKGFWRNADWKTLGKWFAIFACINIVVNFLYYKFDTETEFSIVTILRSIVTPLIFSLWLTWGKYMDKLRDEKSDF